MSGTMLLRLLTSLAFMAHLLATGTVAHAYGGSTSDTAVEASTCHHDGAAHSEQRQAERSDKTAKKPAKDGKATRTYRLPVTIPSVMFGADRAYE